MTEHPYRSAPSPTLSRPPRRIGHRLWLRIAFGGKLTFFTGLWNSFVFGMIFAGALVIESPIDFYDQRVPGVIDRVRDTGSTRGDDDDQRPIYAVDYHFTDERGVVRRGTSYTTSPPRTNESPPVTVELDRDDPSYSRIAGMDRTKSAGPLWHLLFMVPFIAIGLWLARGRYREARSALHLLRHGVPTRGKLVSKRATGTTYEDPTGEYEEQEMTFEYKDARDRVHRATVKTLHPELLEDDQREAILYDPDVPSRATTLDHLPGEPALMRDGTLDPRTGGFPYHHAVLPVAAILAAAATPVVIVVRIIA